MTFPQYRKHHSGKNYYCIEDDIHFTEIQQIGKQTMAFRIEAKTFFEKQRIQDMLSLSGPYLESDESEFTAHKNG
jgi:hypothetical protein